MAWGSWLSFVSFCHRVLTRLFGLRNGLSMGGKPDALVTMRLSDMHRMHPAQDDTHVCSKCGHPVGIYPSGQSALRKWPGMQVLCSHCAIATRRPGEIDNVLAADFDTIMQESRDSVDVGRS
jgi:hypothetical protein